MNLVKIIEGVTVIIIGIPCTLTLIDIVKSTFEYSPPIKRPDQVEEDGNYRLSRKENQGNNNYNPNR